MCSIKIIVNLYPEYDRDNVNALTYKSCIFCKRFPIGDVVINDSKKSITREHLTNFFKLPLMLKQIL